MTQYIFYEAMVQALIYVTKTEPVLYLWLVKKVTIPSYNFCQVMERTLICIKKTQSHSSFYSFLQYSKTFSFQADFWSRFALCYKDGSRPFLIACQKKFDCTVQLLLSKGADINLCMDNGVSPLFSACQRENESIVQPLLLNGANLNLCRNDGTSCLHEACKNGYYGIVKLLLKS